MSPLSKPKFVMGLDAESSSKIFNFLGPKDQFSCRSVCQALRPMFLSPQQAQSLLKRLSCDVMKATNRMAATGRIHDSQLDFTPPKEDLNVHQKTMAICHKGCSSKFHGNTIPAFEESVKIGAEMIELDLILTKDRNIIIHHDPTTPDGSALCLETPMSVIRKKFPEIPTLRELLGNETLFKSGINIYFDLKCPDIVEPLLELLLEAVNGGKWHASRFLIASFDQYDLLDVAAFRSSHNVNFQTIVIVDAMPLGYAACFEELQVNYISIAQGRVIPAFIQDAHRRGMGVFAWTVNDPVLWREFVRMGVDGICTDHPEAFQRDRAALQLERDGLKGLMTVSSKAELVDGELPVLSSLNLYPESFERPRASAIKALQQALPVLRFCQRFALETVDQILVEKLDAAVQQCEKICKRYMEPILVSSHTFSVVLGLLGAAGKLQVGQGDFSLLFENEWVSGLASKGLVLIEPPCKQEESAAQPTQQSSCREGSAATCAHPVVAGPMA
mmetsp:Transcript_39820/g.65259  ORF Transcript_39820/g.65259 Transcript_39820/m.65259 type:complete len:502 (-) Transcript_39820:198-1703(-)